MQILGIDPCSTKNLGWAVYDVYEDFFPEDGIGLMRVDEVGRFLDIYNFMEYMKVWHNISMIAIESSIGFGFAPTRSKIAENTGAIKLAAVHFKIPFISINAKHAYKETVGTFKKGDNKKKKTMEYVEKYELTKSEHTADAAILALCYVKENNICRIN